MPENNQYTTANKILKYKTQNTKHKIQINLKYKLKFFENQINLQMKFSELQIKLKR